MRPRNDYLSEKEIPMLHALKQTCARWWRDPLTHPAIARMTERERADLPFDPARLCPDEGQARP
jgi:hypothetical protein